MLPGAVLRWVATAAASPAQAAPPRAAAAPGAAALALPRAAAVALCRAGAAAPPRAAERRLAGWAVAAPPRARTAAAVVGSRGGQAGAGGWAPAPRAARCRLRLPPRHLHGAWEVCRLSRVWELRRLGSGAGEARWAGGRAGRLRGPQGPAQPWLATHWRSRPAGTLRSSARCPRIPAQEEARSRRARIRWASVCSGRAQGAGAVPPCLLAG